MPQNTIRRFYTDHLKNDLYHNDRRQPGNGRNHRRASRQTSSRLKPELQKHTNSMASPILQPVQHSAILNAHCVFCHICTVASCVVGRVMVRNNTAQRGLEVGKRTHSRSRLARDYLESSTVTRAWLGNALERYGGAANTVLRL